MSTDRSDVDSKTVAVALSLMYIAFGAYGWEFLTTLKYDWILVWQRRHSFRLGSLLYLLTRYSALLFLVVSFSEAVHPITAHCSWTHRLVQSSSYVVMLFSSGLLYLRIVAISLNSCAVLYGLGLLYAVSWGLGIFGVATSTGYYDAELHACIAHASAHQMNAYFTFAFDLVCLVMMLFYLVRLRVGLLGRQSMSSLLIQQGVIYFICVAIAYGVTTCAMVLQLGDGICAIFAFLTLFVNMMCATRMHRELDKHFRNPPALDITTQTDRAPVAIQFRSDTPLKTKAETESCCASEVESKV